MLASVNKLLLTARIHGYAIGAFNVYNLEGVRAVIGAAEAEDSPVILQVHPAALRVGGLALLSLCLAAAELTRVPVGVHFDHSTSLADILAALDLGVRSVMADGSHLPYSENVAFCRQAADLAHAANAVMEVELGRISGDEDGLSVHERNARFTDPAQAFEFIQETKADSLAVCVGNVHGHYQGESNLDLDRLSAIRDVVDIPLVLHGASGLPASTIHQAIALGVCKFNVNTEVRDAYLSVLANRNGLKQKNELLDLIKEAINAMQLVICTKIREFCSGGKASLLSDSVN